MNAKSTELPAEIQALIALVVGRTRLRKAERADIERELAAHFRDGLASGKSVAQLIEAFGEATLSARSIRAGAIAMRPPLDRALRQAIFLVGWSFLAIIALYAGSIGYLWWQAPVIRFDPMERYLAAFPKAAPQDRAWPVYKRGMIALADPIEGTPGTTGQITRLPNKWLAFKCMGEEQGRAIPNQASWVNQCKVLREHREGIDAIVLAASMPALGFVPRFEFQRADDADIYGYDPSVSNFDKDEHQLFHYILLPHVSTLLKAAEFLCADAIMSIEGGDGASFVRDIHAAIGISHHVEEGRLTVSQLFGAQIRDLAFTRIIMAVEWRPEALSGDQLGQLADLLRSIPASDFELDFTTEPILVQDFIQRAYTDNGAGDGVFNPMYGSSALKELTAMYTFGNHVVNDDSMDRSVLAPAGAVANASRKEVSDLYDSMLRKVQEQMQRPLWQQDFSFERDLRTQTIRPISSDSEWSQPKWAIPRMLIPAVGPMVQTRKLGAAQCDAAQTAVALVRYRRAHGGAWPARLEELIPEYFNALPIDPWTGKTVNYEVRDGHAHVWCVCPEDRRFGDGQNDRDVSRWMHSLRANIGERWLWFHGDDKLERWKPTQ